jgi:hypothetical protein
MRRGCLVYVICWFNRAIWVWVMVIVICSKFASIIFLLQVLIFHATWCEPEIKENWFVIFWLQLNDLLRIISLFSSWMPLRSQCLPFRLSNPPPSWSRLPRVHKYPEFLQGIGIERSEVFYFSAWLTFSAVLIVLKYMAFLNFPCVMLLWAVPMDQICTKIRRPGR